ncbi:asparagine synthase (glutamine-hydrolyzing) [Rheinheimera sp.]|uniref:asparagine synthase (glutamine-hydrolyzing) n=1 Tax=Rheinheimera sp. TaxID=1869214 RepID=UPI00307E36A3
MCGLAGVLAPAELLVSHSALLRMMGQSISHRGPDDEGIYTSDCGEFGLVHRRLAIVDLSDAGHQPMFSADKRFVLAFNGEIYNHRELRRELNEIVPRVWRGHSDTETLLAGICQWGLEETITRAVGMFAIALWDTQNKTLTLVRDRAGEKPIYYGYSGGAFLFGSELKALKAHPLFNNEIDIAALSLMLRHKYVPAPRTIYRRFSKLEPGCMLTLTLDDLTSGSLCHLIKRYWSFNEALERMSKTSFAGSDEEALTLLETQLSQTVGEQMLADVQVGAFLSGGTDSSLIAALMQAQSSKPIRTFTVGFHVPGYNEAEHAKSVAEHLHTDHTEIYVTERDALNVIPKLPQIYDEPFGDSSQIPTFLIAKEARRHVTVALSGDGGDELFAGYTRYEHSLKLQRKLSAVPASVFKALSCCRSIFHSDIWRRLDILFGHANTGLLSNGMSRIAELAECDRFSGLYTQVVSDVKDPQRLLHNCPPSKLFSEHDLLPDDQARLMWMMTCDSKTYLPDDVLVKVDRASMAVSLEGRVPMLDHRFIEAALAMPLTVKKRGPIGKWVLKQMLYRHVPQSLLDRPKTGFAVPIDHWLRGPLKDWAEALLDPSKLDQQGIFNSRMVRKYWSEHQSEHRDWQYMLWNILMFQSWLEEQG